MEEAIEKSLRYRFVKSYNIPIQVLHSPYFEQRMELFDSEYNCKEKWNELKIGLMGILKSFCNIVKH